MEGNKYTYECLKYNVEKNSLTKTMTYNVILSNKNELLSLSIADCNNTGTSSIFNNKEKHYVSESISVYGDDLFKDEDNITLVKIDVENSEWFVLQGMINIIKKHMPIIVIELHKTNPYYVNICEFLDELNYKTDGINYASSPTFIYMPLY